MATITIWPGSSSFSDTTNSTPFGFYDSDSEFQTSADKVSTWCAQRLGYPIVDIELQAVNFYTAFEEAITTYAQYVYQYEIIENMGTLDGASTDGDLNNQYIQPNLGNLISIAEGYGTEAGSGGSIVYKTGSIDIVSGQQKYSLTDLWTNVNESGKTYNIKKIYHYAPAAISRYFDPYAGTGTGIQSLMQTFGFGNYSPGVNFMLMPMFFDALKIQAIELNDAIRKSAYHFEISNNRYLKLFPIPTSDYTLWYEYQLKSVANAPVKNDATNLITDISNVPYTNPTYAFINEPGKQWIRRYCLALAKEMLGSIRGKYQALPIPGDTTTLDYARLLSEAITEKTALITELKELLESTTRLKQLERQNQEAQQTQETFYKVPYPIYIG